MFKPGCEHWALARKYVRMKEPVGVHKIHPKLIVLLVNLNAKISACTSYSKERFEHDCTPTKYPKHKMAMDPNVCAIITRF